MSQLAFRNFNYVSGKPMNIPCFFIFVLFSMKAKTFPAHICWKKEPPVCKKNWHFPVQLINIEKTKNDSSLATKEHKTIEALQFSRKINLVNKRICLQNQTTLRYQIIVRCKSNSRTNCNWHSTIGFFHQYCSSECYFHLEGQLIYFYSKKRIDCVYLCECIIQMQYRMLWNVFLCTDSAKYYNSKGKRRSLYHLGLVWGSFLPIYFQCSYNKGLTEGGISAALN